MTRYVWAETGYAHGPTLGRTRTWPSSLSVSDQTIAYQFAACQLWQFWRSGIKHIRSQHERQHHASPHPNVLSCCRTTWRTTACLTWLKHPSKNINYRFWDLHTVPHELQSTQKGRGIRLHEPHSSTLVSTVLAALALFDQCFILQRHTQKQTIQFPVNSEVLCHLRNRSRRRHGLGTLKPQLNTIQHQHPYLANSRTARWLLGNNNISNISNTFSAKVLFLCHGRCWSLSQGALQGPWFISTFRRLLTQLHVKKRIWSG